VVASIPALGGLAVAGLRLAGGDEPSWSNLQSLAGKSTPMSLRAQIARTGAASATLGTGNSLGPEGPSVEIGAVLARTLTSLSSDASRHADFLFICGAAAGVAAGFNAPISAVFFAIEVIQPLQRNKDAASPLPDMPSSDITYILVSSVMASLTARQLLEERLSFKVAEYTLASPAVELPLYIGLGLTCGGIALTFKAASRYFTTVFNGSAPGLEVVGQIPTTLKPAAAGLVCGLVGLAFPQVLFFGYATLDSLLADSGNLGLLDLAILCGLKLLLTALCSSSGLVGGTFAPSLFLGATAGAAYQQVVEPSVALAAEALVKLQVEIGVVPGSWGILPQLSVAPEQAYAMVGAASVLAGLFNAPLTGSLLLFELTQDFDIVLPLMASAGIASLISLPQPTSPPASPGSPQETALLNATEKPLANDST